MLWLNILQYLLQDYYCVLKCHYRTVLPLTA
jgi:hypothetical protein